MTIKDFLQNEKIFEARVRIGSRWLVWESGKWIVYERLLYAKKTTEIIATEDEELAVAKLIEVAYISWNKA